jgi:hypothetical protein
MKMKVKIISGGLAVFLAVIALLAVGSFAYADDPPDDNGLDVDIVVIGDEPDVSVGVEGDNPDVDIGIGGDNPEVWINGINIQDPISVCTVVVQGATNGWVLARINETVAPIEAWISDAEGLIGLTADGLAKVILLAQTNEAQIKLHEDSLGDLGEMIERLKANEAQDYERLTQRLDAVEEHYQKVFLIVVGAFALAVIGLSVALGVLWSKASKR